jgi:GNAT superfamily N-acetyltransferase
MKIQKYEIWMRQQVIDLFRMEYGAEAQNFDTFFGQFYEHPFQENDGIRIAATDGDKVIGFQSFFHWPILLHGQFTHAYQSGNSLVHPDYRGKGLFGKMLNYIHQEEAHLPHDLLIGFPVEMSYGAFMKNKWLNPFDLHWYIKPLNPLLSFFTNPEEQLLRTPLGKRQPCDVFLSPTLAGVQQSKGYDDYRFGYQKGPYYRFEYADERGKVLFELKAQRRKKILKELILGKVVRTTNDYDLLRNAYAHLEKTVRSSANFSFISIAINPLSKDFVRLMEQFRFRPIDKKIHFIAKGPLADKQADWGTWDIFRADIDTW